MQSSLVNLVKSIWEQICDDNLSVAVRDKETKKIEAVTINLDIRTDIDHIVIEEPAVAAINCEVEKEVKRELLESDEKWIDSFLTAIDASSNDDVLSILNAMEAYSVEMATVRGFDGIIVVNSHPITIVSFLLFSLNHVNTIYAVNSQICYNKISKR